MSSAVAIGDDFSTGWPPDALNMMRAMLNKDPSMLDLDVINEGEIAAEALAAAERVIGTGTGTIRVNDVYAAIDAFVENMDEMGGTDEVYSERAVPFFFPTSRHPDTDSNEIIAMPPRFNFQVDELPHTEGGQYSPANWLTWLKAILSVMTPTQFPYLAEDIMCEWENEWEDEGGA